MTFDIKNLVVLMYAQNNCYTTLVEAADPSVKKAEISIDAKAGTWSRSGEYGRKITHKIGTSHYFERGSRFGGIAVYDRTKMEHLNSMLHASQEATRDDRYSDD